MKRLLAQTALLILFIQTTFAMPSLDSNIQTERITFQSGDATLVGTLHLPASYQEGSALPGIVVTGAWMTVKEQMAGRYARELAERGFATLTFDFRGWGESGGTRRQLENPSEKIEDILAAIAFLESRPEVTTIGGLGICASAGYMTTAATRSDRMASVALVAPWLHDAAIVEATYGGAAIVESLITAGRSAEAAFAQTGVQQFIPAASLTDASAIMYGAPYYTEPERGMIPEWRNEVDPAFWEGWLTFDALHSASGLQQPFFMVHSEAAAIPQGAHQFYDRLATQNKNELWIEETSQFAFYDGDTPVATASDAVASHFAATLGVEPAQVRIKPDAARVAATVAQVGTLADNRAWKSLRALYADNVHVDYTALQGGEPASIRADDLLAQWAAFLPGFDRTDHQLGTIEVQFDGGQAIAETDVVAVHTIDSAEGGDTWTVKGHYTYRLQQAASAALGWEVVSHQLSDVTMEGNGALPAIAVERAAQPISDAATVVETFFATLEAMDIGAFLEVWAEDGVQIMPFSPQGFPKRLEGKAAIHDQYRSLPENFASMRFPRTFTATEVPGQILVRYTGEIELKQGGRYDNTYVGLFTVRDGKIVEFVEYFDPIVLVQAFGIDLQSNFNVSDN